VTAPDGYLFTALNRGEPDADSDAGSDGVMSATILTSGETDLTWDAGLYRPATLGDRVWQDTNSDGLQTSGEAGFADVTVTLDGRTGAGATVSLTTTTDATGFYTFTTLAPGTYTVTVTAPEGYVFTQRNVGNDATRDNDADATGVMSSTILASGQIDLTWDAGLYQRSSLGDRVWDDRNANGVQDEGELGIAGVTVTLYAADGTTVLRATTTDNDGLYRFDELEAGSYIIGFDLPDGFVRSITGGTSDRALDSDADQSTGRTRLITLPTATSDLTWDAGIYQPAQLGDRVWLDRNANGLQDIGETGLANVVVTLFGEDGTTVIRTTTTNEDGIYQFTYLDPGTYSIGFTPPSGYELSPQGQGEDAELDSDANPQTGRTEPITLEPGQSDLRYDAGLFQRVAVGDRVWLDLNNNGLIDPDEQGLAEIEVLLYTDRANDGLPDGAAIASTTT
ncbi:MAG: calcium-binding protein, partial [Chloroflexia bacterium]|nr:calcium-binding protein [Chloroflexia bacterium]